MGGLSISILGSLTVQVDGQPVNRFEYNKVKGLLAYLIVESDRPHRRETLAGLLWPDQSQKAALDSLRNALSTLRQAINDLQAQPTYFLTTKDTIQFNHSSDHWLDAERFTQLLYACQTHRHRRIEGCPTCTDRLIEASNLYRGEFLQGFSFPDSDLFEDWLRLKREKYNRLAIDALQQLAASYERNDDAAKALQYSQRQLELDPCREEAHAQAIRLYATQGMRADACAQYQRCKQVLLEELGVEPTDETTHLYESIKYGLFQPAPSRQSLRINNLPTDLTSFVGRAQELEEINALIEDPACRLLSLVGPGGVGKTRLAIAAAAGLQEAFLHGACFVPLAAVSSVELIVPAILKALDLKQAEQGDLRQTEQGDLKQQLFEYMNDKELILVLDNFEHLTDGGGIVTEILQQASGVMVLVTSRHRLNLQAEWIFEVNGLSYPNSKDLQNLAGYESVQLFTSRLRQVKPRQTVFQDDLPGMARICQLVEGLPLGIELAASAVRKKSIEHIASAIESGNDDLAVSLKDVPERHRSLRAVFEHSYRMLSEEEQKAFCGLAVFRGSFTAEAAQQVAGATPEVLESLVEHSMIRYDPDKERYDLHELVQQFAQEKLRTQGMDTHYHQQHLRYYIDLTEQAYNIVIDTLAWSDVIRLEPEMENCRAAMDWCFNSNQLELALQMAGALVIFYGSLGNMHESKAWLETIFKSDHIFKPDRYYARALMYWADSIKCQEPETAKALSEQSLSIMKELGDERWFARTLTKLYLVYAYQGDLIKSLEMLEEALQIYQKLGDLKRVAITKYCMADTYPAFAHPDSILKARTLCQEALEIDRQLGSQDNRPDDIALELVTLGEVEMRLGNFGKARELLEEAIALIKDRPNQHGSFGIIINYLGLTCFYLKDYSSARENFEWGMEIANEVGDKNLPTLCNLSYLLCFQCEFERALYYSKEIFRQLPDADKMLYMILNGWLMQLPWVLTACGEPERAAKLYGFTDGLFVKLNVVLPPYILPDYERDLTETRRQLGEAAFNALWEEGRSMTLEEAKACAAEAKVRVVELQV